MSKRIYLPGSWLLALAVCAIFLTGCATQYIVVLTNGQRFTSVGKPHLEQLNGGQFNFVFVDPEGQTNSIPSGKVRGVAPASELKP